MMLGAGGVGAKDAGERVDGCGMNDGIAQTEAIPSKIGNTRVKVETEKRRCCMKG